MNKVIEKLLADLEENGLEILNYNQVDGHKNEYLITTNYALIHFDVETGEMTVSFSVNTIAENSAVLALMFERLENVKKIDIGRSYFTTKDGIVMGEEAYNEYQKKLITDVSKEIFIRQKQIDNLKDIECFHC